MGYYPMSRLQRLEIHSYTILELNNRLFEQLLIANCRTSTIPVKKREIKMSFGFGVGDIIAVSKLAHSLWAKVRDSSDQFNAIRSE